MLRVRDVRVPQDPWVFLYSPVDSTYGREDSMFLDDSKLACCAGEDVCWMMGNSRNVDHLSRLKTIPVDCLLSEDIQEGLCSGCAMILTDFEVVPVRPLARGSVAVVRASLMR